MDTDSHGLQEKTERTEAKNGGKKILNGEQGEDLHRKMNQKQTRSKRTQAAAPVRIFTGCKYTRRCSDWPWFGKSGIGRIRFAEPNQIFLFSTETRFTLGFSIR